ncbi:peptidoglycan-binding protein [Brevibacterium sp. XM4083]|uniref:peptidoglycan-binding protein n=1 Tax=Brevibacterium sp. XM4083 TaxID=2583238 RepID=UPI001128F6A1|nr:peptidoglycan-binding protein [Brevibacterium sp. XM4083]MCM1011087.1 peptidoglycan-binding protein [Brevibacterium sp. XM4083]
MPRQTRHRKGRRSPLVGALIGLGAAAAALAIAAVVIINAPVSFGSTTIRQMQMSSVQQLNQQQIDNARLIIAVGRGGGFDDEAIRIALMTALQESSLRNIDYGDRDSVGLFQQRPSQGWGDPSELTDRVFATKSFYGINPEVHNPGLDQIENWHRMTPTEAAQAVQRSAYPDAYGQWETLADDLIGTQTDVEALP